jgi:hypothetical protein
MKPRQYPTVAAADRGPTGDPGATIVNPAQIGDTTTSKTHGRRPDSLILLFEETLS